ncbi:MAG: hypothetical protein HGB28_05380, partial [Oscillochloris sp.]|nr:hypothetical protein [Oscillochloris sp.]
RSSDLSCLLPPASYLLEQLEQAHLFIVRLDAARPWYRYHHLFHEFLRRRLDRDQPGRRAQLHRQAARWYAAAGEVTQAVNHALAAEDMPYAADLIVRVAWEQLSSRGEIATLLGWAERLPQDQLEGAPLLSLSLGRAAAMSAQATTAERFFAMAEQGLARTAANDPHTAKTHMKLLLYRASAALMDGAVGRGEALLAAVEPALPADDPGMIAGHALAVGLGQLLRGNLTAAYAALDHLEQMAHRARHEHFIVDAVQLLVLADVAAGDLAHAERRGGELFARFGSNLPPIPALAVVLARLGSVAYYRGQLDQAEQILRQGAQHGRRTSGRAPRQTWQWLVRVKIAQRDQDGLRALLAEDEGRGSMAGGAVLASLMLALRAEGMLALGARDDAWEWAQRCDQVPGEHLREPETITIARVLLARGHPAEALARLAPLIAAAEQGGRVQHQLEGLIVQAHALHDLQRTPEALAALRQALALAEPRGYVQPFLDQGPLIAALLERMKDAPGSATPYAAQLLTLSPQPSALSPQPLVEPLTERERDVLRLIAEGATNQDIAERLVVSVGTVKTHLNHILGKLNARNRTEAVARARLIGLI